MSFRYAPPMTDPVTPHPSLIAVARVVLEEAKQSRSRAKKLQQCILFVGLLAVIVQALPVLVPLACQPDWLAVECRRFAYLSAVMAFALQATRWFLSRHAASRHALGCTLNRRARLVNSLGRSTEQTDIRLLRESAGQD